MTTPVQIRIYLNAIDLTSRLIGDITWDKGRPNPGSIRREIQAGRAEIRLDNTDGYFTKNIGGFFIRPGSRLVIGVTHNGVTHWPIPHYRIAGHSQNVIEGGYTVIDATFGGILYRITSSELPAPLVAGRADRVLRRLVNLIDPSIVIDNPNNLMQQGLVIYEDSVTDAILSLLQITDTTLIETGGDRFRPDHIEIIGKGSGTAYHLYDGGLNSEIPIFVEG